MEIKELEKTVIAKPVAWRPAFSDFKSFPELLAGQVDVTVPAALSETSVAAIRPKTVRFKPVNSTDLARVEVSGSDASFQTNKVPESNVVYRPVAKLVSKMTVSFLANLGQRSNDIYPEQDITKGGGHVQPPTEVKNYIDPTADPDQSCFRHTEINIKSGSENHHSEKKFLLPPDNRDRPAYDGHNWRKYGQKHVKGSEYSRSYYKCTYPNCPVKKKVEITIDGEIAERIYKGEHNHSKPHTVMSTRQDAHVQIPASDAVKNQSCGETEMPNCNTVSSAVPPANDARTATTYTAGVPTSNNSFCASDDHVGVKDTVEAEDGDFIRKRRKCQKNQSVKAGEEGNATAESRIFVQNNDSETTGDGFRWRKYGQKIVKGNSYPRSYYRCTSSKCSAKKYVEKTTETGTFITTYEGGHNHEMPVKGTARANSSPTPGVLPQRAQ